MPPCPLSLVLCLLLTIPSAPKAWAMGLPWSSKGPLSTEHLWSMKSGPPGPFTGARSFGGIASWTKGSQGWCPARTWGVVSSRLRLVSTAPPNRSSCTPRFHPPGGVWHWDAMWREKEKGGAGSGKVKGSGTCWGLGWCCLFPVLQLRAGDTQDAKKGVTAWIYCISSCLNPNKPSLFTVYQGLGEALRRGLCGQDPAWAGRQQAGSRSGLGVSKLVERGRVCVSVCECVCMYAHVYVPRAGFLCLPAL